jgi:CheY-like chemotaxis protein
MYVSSVSPVESRHNKQALVVYKDQPTRLTARSLLSSFGFQVIESDDGRHALSVAKKRPCIDLLVMDSNPPGIDGWTLATSYLDVCPLGRAVVMSADDEVQSINRESNGGWRFVPKSRLPAMLLDVIQSFGLTEPRRVILLAENEPMVRKLAQAVLAQAGHAVIAAVDGQEALELSRAYSAKIDLVISDIEMPRMDGVRLAEQIKKERPETPVLLMSGFFECVLPAHTNLIQKPFTPKRFAAKVHELLGTETTV